MENLYQENDVVFKKIYNIKVAEEEDEEVKKAEEDEGDKNEINIYQKKDFELDKVLIFFFNNDLITKVQFSPKYGKPMKLENNKNYIDEKYGDAEQK